MHDLSMDKMDEMAPSKAALTEKEDYKRRDISKLANEEDRTDIDYLID